MILSSDCIINIGDKNDSIATCHTCDEKPADIFQAEGDYCLECWQELTYPNL